MGSDPVELRTLAMATAGVIAVESLARWAISQRGIDPLAGVGLARLVDIAWMALIISRCPRGWNRTGLAAAGWRSGLIRGLIWSAGFGILAAIGYALLYMAGLDPLRIIRPGPTAFFPNPALLFWVGGFIAPIAEEIYFRGLMYGYCRRWGFWPALFLSTLVFTLLHGSAPGAPIPQFVGSLVFATAYEIEKSLLVPILIHILGNLAIFSLLSWF
jgi:membrane protease YdiL (CAAX protease family)